MYSFPKFVFKDVTQSAPTAQQLGPQLRIRKPQYRKEGVDLSPQAQGVLSSSFVMLILGKPGSGKSHLISQLVTQKSFYGNRFDRIIYIGPTRYPGVLHDDYNTHNSCDMGFIAKRISQCSEWAQNMLIVMDDVISQIPSTQKNRLQQMFYNRRHQLKKGTISIILTAQKYTSVPTWIRTTLTCLFIFSVSKAQTKTMMNEIPTFCSTEHILTLLGNLPKHQFLFLNLQKGKIFDNDFHIV